MRLHQGPLVFRFFFDRFDTCDRCRRSCRVRLRAVVGTKGGAIRRSMSRLSAVDAEVLFAGELLGCFIETRDARGCVWLGGSLGRGRGRSNGGAGNGSSGSIGARGVWICHIRKNHNSRLVALRASDALDVLLQTWRAWAFPYFFRRCLPVVRRLAASGTFLATERLF